MTFFFYGASFPVSLSAAESEKIVIAAASEAVKCPCNAQLLSFIMHGYSAGSPFPFLTLVEDTDAKRMVSVAPAGNWRALCTWEQILSAEPSFVVFD